MTKVVIFWTLIGLLTIGATLFIAIPLLRVRSNRSRFSIILIGFFPLIAVGLYWIIGNSKSLNQLWTAQQNHLAIQNQLASITDSQQLINLLQSRLKKTPQSAEGWFLLGKLYLLKQRYGEAKQAFTHATKLEPKNKDYKIILAKAIFLNKKHLPPAIEELLKNMLKSEPQQTEILNLLAVNAYQRKDYRLAVNYWQQILPLVQPDSNDSHVLLDMIWQAQRQEKILNPK